MPKTVWSQVGLSEDPQGLWTPVDIALCRDQSLGRVKMNMDGQKYGWTGNQMKEQKGLPKP